MYFICDLPLSVLGHTPVAGGGGDDGEQNVTKFKTE